jgi:hypothetical protein
VDEGQPLLAIGLAEVALLDDPTGTVATEVMRDAHLALLDDHARQNLWLSGWLESRIADYGATS